MEAYEAALRREGEFPELKTQAFPDLPYLVALRTMVPQHDRALEILSQRKGDLMFPVDYFKWHASHAMILYAKGDLSQARSHARAAFEAASRDRSNFRFHPTVGLVSDRHSDAVARVNQFHDA